MRATFFSLLLFSGLMVLIGCGVKAPPLPPERDADLHIAPHASPSPSPSPR